MKYVSIRLLNIAAATNPTRIAIVAMEAVTVLSVRVETKIPTAMKHIPIRSIAIREPAALPTLSPSSA